MKLSQPEPRTPPLAAISSPAWTNWSRTPAAVLAVGLATGIVAGDFGVTPPFEWNAVLSAILLAAWVGLWNRSRRHLGVTCLMLAAVLIGAARQQWATQLIRGDDLAAAAGEVARPMIVVGRVMTTPVVSMPRKRNFPAAVPEVEQTSFQVRVEWIGRQDDGSTATGLVRVFVRERVVGPMVGDRVHLIGRLMQPAARRNPGAFDFQKWLRRRGVHSILSCETAEAVRVVDAASHPFDVVRNGVRSRLHAVCQQHLGLRNGPLAEAILLGNRTFLPPETRSAFENTGMMHVMAVSGANVAVVGACLWVLAVVCGLPRRSALLFLSFGLLIYGLVSEPEAPVLRALVMAAVLILGRFSFQTADVVHALGIAAAVLMILDPGGVFDIGAQLSFLAILALAWTPIASNLVSSIVEKIFPQGSSLPTVIRADSIPEGQTPRFQDRVRSLLAPAWDSVRLAATTTAVVWLFTIPLCAATFHLVTPLGFLVSVALAPLVAGVMWIGYLFLLVGLAWSPLATPLGILFGGGLTALITALELAASVTSAQFRVAGPTTPWLVAYYAALAVLFVAQPGGIASRWSIRGLVLLAAAAIIGVELPSRPAGLRCTFLSIGHGLGVLVELPNGRTLLYDAGQLQNGRNAARIVEGAIFHARKQSVDAWVISHADLDHFNAAPELFERRLVSSVWVHPQFFQSRQASAQLTMELCLAAGVPLRTLTSGNVLRWDGPAANTVVIRVVHPRADSAFRSDNARSLVLAIEYAGRRVMLTGDIERDGLAVLLSQPALKCDVLSSPHHGGVDGNTPQLAEWAKPGVVVASCGVRGVRDRLERVYGPKTRCFATFEDGAVVVNISPDGAMSVRSMLSGRGEGFAPDRSPKGEIAD